MSGTLRVSRSARSSRIGTIGLLLTAVVLAVLPFVTYESVTSNLVSFFVLVVIASMWNLLAGFGGLGSLWGTLLGGLALGLTQSIVAIYDPSSTILAGHLVFLAVLAFRPQGLIPARAV